MHGCVQVTTSSPSYEMTFEKHGRLNNLLKRRYACDCVTLVREVNCILELITTNISSKHSITRFFWTFSHQCIFQMQKTLKYNKVVQWIKVYKEWEQCYLTILRSLQEIHLKRTCTYDIFLHDHVSIIYNLY